MSQPMQPISRWSDIPAFDDEETEARFWETHELEARLMSGSIHEPDSLTSTGSPRPISGTQRRWTSSWTST